MLKKMAHMYRILATASAFILFGVGGAIVPWLAYPFIRLAPITDEKKQRCARRLIQKVFLLFIRYMKLVGVVTWEVEGLERLNRPRLLLLANHPTLIDVVFLVAFLPNADCIVKGALLNNPAMRGFIKLTGFIANNTGPELVADAQQSLDKGGVLVVFPEGTRTKPGEGLNFQRGAANLAVRTQTDVTPVVITCTPWGLSKNHKWYDGASEPMRFVFKVGPDLPVAPYAEMQPSKSARQLTRDLEQYFCKELKEWIT